MYSGNKIDMIKIFSVGGNMENIKRIYPDVVVENVKNRDVECFENNKTYMTNQYGKEVIYLDEDTIVLGKI